MMSQCPSGARWLATDAREVDQSSSEMRCMRTSMVMMMSKRFPGRFRVVSGLTWKWASGARFLAWVMAVDEKSTAVVW